VFPVGCRGPDGWIGDLGLIHTSSVSTGPL
jgi:hypothetical protein